MAGMSAELHTDRRLLRNLARDAERLAIHRARAFVTEARARKRSARQRGRELCEQARTSFKRWRAAEASELRRRIAELRAELKAGTLERRAKVAACCGKEERTRVRAASDAAIAAARAELETLRTEQRRTATWSRGRPAGRAVGRTKEERKQQSDHEVEVNLSPEQLIVWAKVKKKIKGTPRMSRTEAFQHWIHEHSGEVNRIMEADAAVALKKALAEQKREHARMKKLKREAKGADVAAAVQRLTTPPPASVRPPSAGASKHPSARPSKRPSAPPKAKRGGRLKPLPDGVAWAAQAEDPPFDHEYEYRLENMSLHAFPVSPFVRREELAAARAQLKAAGMLPPIKAWPGAIGYSVGRERAIYVDLARELKAKTIPAWRAVTRAQASVPPPLAVGESPRAPSVPPPCLASVPPPAVQEQRTYRRRRPYYDTEQPPPSVVPPAAPFAESYAEREAREQREEKARRALEDIRVRNRSAGWTDNENIAHHRGQDAGRSEYEYGLVSALDNASLADLLALQGPKAISGARSGLAHAHHWRGKPAEAHKAGKARTKRQKPAEPGAPTLNIRGKQGDVRIADVHGVRIVGPARLGYIDWGHGSGIYHHGDQHGQIVEQGAKRDGLVLSDYRGGRSYQLGVKHVDDYTPRELLERCYIVTQYDRHFRSGDKVPAALSEIKKTVTLKDRDNTVRWDGKYQEGVYLTPVHHGVTLEHVLMLEHRGAVPFVVLTQRFERTSTVRTHPLGDARELTLPKLAELARFVVQGGRLYDAEELYERAIQPPTRASVAPVPF